MGVCSSAPSAPPSYPDLAFSNGLIHPPLRLVIREAEARKIWKTILAKQTAENNDQNQDGADPAAIAAASSPRHAWKTSGVARPQLPPLPPVHHTQFPVLYSAWVDAMAAAAFQANLTSATAAKAQNKKKAKSAKPKRGDKYSSADVPTVAESAAEDDQTSESKRIHRLRPKIEDSIKYLLDNQQQYKQFLLGVRLRSVEDPMKWEKFLELCISGGKVMENGKFQWKVHKLTEEDRDRKRVQDMMKAGADVEMDGGEEEPEAQAQQQQPPPLVKEKSVNPLIAALPPLQINTDEKKNDTAPTLGRVKSGRSGLSVNQINFGLKIDVDDEKSEDNDELAPLSPMSTKSPRSPSVVADGLSALPSYSPPMSPQSSRLSESSNSPSQNPNAHRHSASLSLPLNLPKIGRRDSKFIFTPPTARGSGISVVGAPFSPRGSSGMIDTSFSSLATQSAASGPLSPTSPPQPQPSFQPQNQSPVLATAAAPIAAAPASPRTPAGGGTLKKKTFLRKSTVSVEDSGLLIKHAMNMVELCLDEWRIQRYCEYFFLKTRENSLGPAARAAMAVCQRMHEKAELTGETNSDESVISNGAKTPFWSEPGSPGSSRSSGQISPPEAGSGKKAKSSDLEKQLAERLSTLAQEQNGINSHSIVPASETSPKQKEKEKEKEKEKAKAKQKEKEKEKGKDKDKDKDKSLIGADEALPPLMAIFHRFPPPVFQHLPNTALEFFLQQFYLPAPEEISAILRHFKGSMREHGVSFLQFMAAFEAELTPAQIERIRYLIHVKFVALQRFVKKKRADKGALEGADSPKAAKDKKKPKSKSPVHLGMVLGFNIGQLKVYEARNRRFAQFKRKYLEKVKKEDGKKWTGLIVGSDVKIKENFRNLWERPEWIANYGILMQPQFFMLVVRDLGKVRYCDIRQIEIRVHLPEDDEDNQDEQSKSLVNNKMETVIEGETDETEQAEDGENAEEPVDPQNLGRFKFIDEEGTGSTKKPDIKRAATTIDKKKAKLQRSKTGRAGDWGTGSAAVQSAIRAVTKLPERRAVDDSAATRAAAAASLLAPDIHDGKIAAGKHRRTQSDLLSTPAIIAAEAKENEGETDDFSLRLSDLSIPTGRVPYKYARLLAICLIPCPESLLIEFRQGLRDYAETSLGRPLTEEEFNQRPFHLFEFIEVMGAFEDPNTRKSLYFEYVQQLKAKHEKARYQDQAFRQWKLEEQEVTHWISE